MCLRQAGWDSFSTKEQQNPGPGPRRAKRLAQLSASPQGRNGGTLSTTSCSESSLHLRDPGDLSPPQSSHSHLEPAYIDVKPQREKEILVPVSGYHPVFTLLTLGRSQAELIPVLVQ